MGDTGGGKGVVVAIRPRHKAQGMCSCGWVGKPRLMLSAAKTDALIHAARRGCEPAIPLIQPESINPTKPPGILTVKCPAGCGASLAVPLVIDDIPSVSADAGELDIRFVAEAPELHDYIYTHLRTCPAPRPRSVAAALHQAAG
jgi:hypothetical protein